MRQTLHILQKDVRHLWIEIAVVLASIGLFAFVHTHADFWRAKTQMPQTVASFVVSLLLPVSWWALIVRAVHGETLVGEREFWITRPYSWKSLLAAKLLFIALFVNLPTLVVQALILHAHGFSLAGELGALLWNQVLFTLAFVLPVTVTAALTMGMVQFLVIGLVVTVAMIFLSLPFDRIAMALVGGGWGPLDWIRSGYVLLVAAIAVPALLVWQYSARRTWAGRIGAGALALVAALGVPLSWAGGFAVQSHFSRRPSAGSAIRAGFSSDFQWMTRALVSSGHRVSLSIPLQLTGVPDDLDVKPEGASITIEAPGGAVWRVAGPPAGTVTESGQLFALRTEVDEWFYRKVRDQAVALRGTVYLTLYGDRRQTKVPFTGQFQPVPGMGVCSATGGPPAPYSLSCYSSMRPRASRVAIEFEPHPLVLGGYSSRFRTSYSPLPAELSIDPVSPSNSYSTFPGHLDSVTVSSEEPVAFVRAPLAIDGLRLASYEARIK